MRSHVRARWIVVAVAMVMLAGRTTAQIVVRSAANPPYDPVSLVNNVFLGDGVEITSVTYDGIPSAAGYFEEGAGPVGLSSGVVLTTGVAESTINGVILNDVGANSPSEENAQHDNGSTVRDDNLELLVPYLQPGTADVNIHDVARYTITFIPKGDKVSFRYVFASEEYPQFVCSEFNDLFGFFISGPGISGPYQDNGINMALVPGTNSPVTINSINSGVVGVSGDIAYCTGTEGSLANALYYRDNQTAGQYPAYNGLTQVLTAEADVIPCSTYTIQITIGDVRDAAYDSGVFLEAKSFSASKLNVTLDAPSLGNELAEGCSPATITFGYSDVQPVDRTVTFTTNGTATSGVDYAPLPSSVVVPAGQQTASIVIDAYEDGAVEGPETITIEVQTDPCTTESLTLTIVDRTIVPVPPLRDTTLCPGEPVVFDATLPLAVDAATTFENTVPLTIFTTNAPLYRDIAVSGVSPNELTADAITEVCLDLKHARLEDLDIFLFSPSGKTLELTTDNGLGDVDGKVCFSLDANNPIADPTLVAPFEGTYQPEGSWSDLAGPGQVIDGTWRLQITDDKNNDFGLLRSWSIGFAAKYTLVYDWSPAAGLSCTDCPDPVASPMSTTNYRVAVTDSYGCTEEATVGVSVYGAAVAPVVTCTPGFDAIRFDWPADANALRYEVRVDGGAWVDVGSDLSYTASGLAFGQAVALDVRAVGACNEAIGSQSCVTQNCPNITVVATPSPASCAGYDDGRAVITVSGGVSPYSFTIGTETNSTGVFPTLSAGSYTAVVLDANGCQGTASVTITEPAGMSTAATLVPPATCGQPYTATASASGGSGAPYSFAWSDGQTGATASFTTSNTYVVTIADGSGCLTRDSVTVEVPEVLGASFDVSPISCAGADDGQITVHATGGRPGYSYSIGGAYQADSTFSNLQSGVSYTVTVVDLSSCSYDTTLTYDEPLPLTVDFVAGDVGCFGERTGYLKAVVTNNRGPVSFDWEDFVPDVDSIGDLAAGSYTLVATDSAGCRVSATGIVREPTILTAASAVDSVTCFGESSGAVTVQARGGTAPYTFVMAGGTPQADSVFASLPAGTYDFGVTDVQGCTTSVSGEVREPLPPGGFHQLALISCAGATDGEIDLTITGGRTPYTFAWADGATTEDRAGLAAGAYAVRVTDAGGCTFDYEVTLDDPDAIKLNAEQVNVGCFGYRDARITTALTGGRPPYDFSWTGPNDYVFFGADPQNLAAGTYQLRFRDSYGCGVDTSFQITQPGSISLETQAKDTICFGAGNGVAFVTVTGGTAPFAYNWSNGETGDTARAYTAGFAVVTVTDAKSCVFEDSIEIASLEPLRLELSQSPVKCYRDSNGRAEITAISYGSRVASLNAFAIEWRSYPDSARLALTGLGGDQEVYAVATDARGCEVTDSIRIGEPAPLDLRPEVLQDVSCKGGADGAATIDVAGGTGTYTFAWGNHPSTERTNVSLSAGQYSVRVTDAEACVDSTTVTVREPDSLLATFSPTQVNCFDEFSGAIEVNASGGNFPYGFQWAHGPVSRRADSLNAGAYTVIITDRKGCTLTEQIEIVRDVAVTITSEMTPATCFGETDGSIFIEASGGLGPYRYRLGAEEYSRFGDFRFLTPGDYAVEAVDRNGCPSPPTVVTVEEPQPLLVEAGGEVSVELGDSVVVDARIFNASGEVDIQWLPRDSGLFDCPTCFSTLVRPRYQGTIRVVATDARGCVAEDVLQVRLKKSVPVLVPTGFTPNADGRDDLLLVHGKTGSRVRSFQVFNRWGELVHEALDFPVNAVAGGWDGSFRGGHSPAGTYIWKAEVVFLDGSVETANGQTTLIR